MLALRSEELKTNWMSEEKVLQLYCNNIAKAEAAMREAKSAGRALAQLSQL